eukprot:11196812-Lingulodinium_polyedra.AAC.1
MEFNQVGDQISSSIRNMFSHDRVHLSRVSPAPSVRVRVAAAGHAAIWPDAQGHGLSIPVLADP